MNDKAEAADHAATQGRMGSLFQIVRELSQAKEHKKRFGLRRSDNLQQEAEDWKEHFWVIQEGVGTIPDEIWQDIAPQGPQAYWLSSPPSFFFSNAALLKIVAVMPLQELVKKLKFTPKSRRIFCSVFFLQCRIAQDSCGHVPARSGQKEVN